MESYEILWKKTLSELEKIVGSISYDTFFAPIIPVDIVGKKIVLCIDYKLFMCYNKHKSFGGELEYEYCRRTTKRT